VDVTKRVPGRKLVSDENISAKQVLDHNLQWKQLQKRLDVLQVTLLTFLIQKSLIVLIHFVFSLF